MGVSPHVMACTKELYSQQSNYTSEEWLVVTNEVLYYLYPAVIGLALIFAIINSIVTAKMVTDSHECYLAGFNISAMVMILASAVIHLPSYLPLVDKYMEFYDGFRLALPYLLAVENQCFYTCSWLLITAVTERMGHAMCGKWHSSFGKIHGILASLMIVIVCFVFTLPQYWEYQTSIVLDDHLGKTCQRLVIAPSDAVIEVSGGYVSEYIWYRWFLMAFSIGLPYLLMPIMLAPVCCVKTHDYSHVNGNGHISTYADDYSTKDYLTDDKTFNRLLAVTVAVYLLMTGPRNAVRILHDPPFFMSICDSKLMADTLSLLFDICFYLFFFILFFFNMCCSAKYRRYLNSLRRCCCCCTRTAEIN